MTTSCGINLSVYIYVYIYIYILDLQTASTVDSNRNKMYWSYGNITELTVLHQVGHVICIWSHLTIQNHSKLYDRMYMIVSKPVIYGVTILAR